MSLVKQTLQNLRSGVIELAEVPSPLAQRGTLVIHTRASLISGGTERMVVEFSQSNLLQKARSQQEGGKQRKIGVGSWQLGALGEACWVSLEP